MRTSLIEIREIDRYLNNEMSISEKLVFESRLQIDEMLKENLNNQVKANAVIKEFGRQKLLQDILVIEERLFSESKFKTFQSKVYSIFKPK